MKRIAVLGVMAIAFLAARASASTPSCSTFDGTNHPAGNFGAGDEIVVRGTGFQPNSLVLVTFQQGTRTAEVSHLKANDLGAFTTDPSTSKLPDAVDHGPATIQVLQGSGAASCKIQLVTTATDRASGFGRGVYLIWGGLLALVAIGLAIATVRRWQGEKLADEMDSISWEKPAYLEADAEPEETAFFQVVDADERPLLEMPEAGDAGEEQEVVAPVTKDATSDTVARLRREVRSWRTG